jgi:tetratricopeptide (TPR) repeat protein
MIAKEKPRNAEAYEFYLRGVDCYLRSEYRAAVELLEQSVERDGGYAPAWAHLGRAHTACASFKFGGKDDYEKAAAAYRLALAINPQQIEANVFLANFLTDTNRVEEAVPLLQAALKSNPNHAEAHWEMGYAYRYAGMLDESIRECETARSIDPEVKLRSSAMNAYLYRGRYADFVKSIPPGDESAFLVFYRGFGKYYLGDFKGAKTDLERAHALDPSLLFTQVGYALARAREGDRETGLRLMRDLESRIEANEIGDAEGIYKIAQAFAVCGDRAAALRVLKTSVDGGFFCAPYIAEDPLLNDLRGEKAFADILQTAKIRHEAFIKRFAPR